MRLALDADDPQAALARAHVLIRGALQGSGIDPASVRQSVAEGWR